MMRASDILGEALRNVRSGSTRAGLLATALFLAAAALLVADVHSIAALQRRAQAVEHRAGDVRVIRAEGGIDSASCSALAGLHLVRDAGAVWEHDPVRLLALPQVSVPVYQMTPGVGRVLGFPLPQAGGFYISETLAERWHARQGSHVATSSGAVTIAGTFSYADDGRDPRLSNALVVLGDAHTPASECWYSVWPPTSAADPFAFAAAASGGEGSLAEVAPLNPSVGHDFDFADEYRSRPTALAGSLVVLLYAVAASAGVLLRRVEVVGNLHAGASHRDVCAVLAVEALLWAGTASVVTHGAVMLSMKLSLIEPMPEMESWLRICLMLGIAAAALGATVPAALAQESRLFALFKARS
jgi:hypothetical protein